MTTKKCVKDAMRNRHALRRTLGACLIAASAQVAVQSAALQHVSASPPPDGICTDPSGICPPTSSDVVPRYDWAYCSCTGGTSEEFTGTTLPSDFADFQTTCSSDPNNTSYAGDYTICSVPGPNSSGGAPSSEDAWFSDNEVSVSGGELHLGTSWASGITDCNDYWGYVVGIDGGPDAPASGCWATGTVSQQTSVWPWPSGATEHFAFEAKWTGTDDIPYNDSTLQAASDYPPEVDVVETTVPGSSFNTFIHCEGESATTQDSQNTSVDLTEWHTYEFDVTSSDIYIYVDGTLEWTLPTTDSYCTGEGVGAGDGQVSADWIPSAANGDDDLGAFMEAVMGAGQTGYAGSSWDTKNQTMLIDWIAESS